MMQLLRVFFPSWKFFDELAPATAIELRHSDGAGEFGPWTRCECQHARGIFINAQGNLAHACQSLLETAVREVSESSGSFGTSVPYRLLVGLARFQLPREARRFQFRVSVGGDEALLSAEHEV